MAQPPVPKPHREFNANRIFPATLIAALLGGAPIAIANASNLWKYDLPTLTLLKDSASN